MYILLNVNNKELYTRKMRLNIFCHIEQKKNQMIKHKMWNDEHLLIVE